MEASQLVGAQWGFTQIQLVFNSSVNSVFAGGGIGSHYTVIFVWPQGGGGLFGRDEVRRDVTHGQVFPV